VLRNRFRKQPPRFGNVDHPVVMKSVNADSASFMLYAKLLGGSASEKAVTF
jgi:hypothetical protein